MKRSSSCATARPVSSIASFIISRGLLTLRRPAASTRPSGECAPTRSTIAVDTPCWRRSFSTLSSRPAGATRERRNVTERSMISANATTEARIKGQIGQPTAWMIANTLSGLRYAKAEL